MMQACPRMRSTPRTSTSLKPASALSTCSAPSSIQRTARRSSRSASPPAASKREPALHDRRPLQVPRHQNRRDQELRGTGESTPQPPRPIPHQPLKRILHRTMPTPRRANHRAPHRYPTKPITATPGAKGFVPETPLLRTCREGAASRCYFVFFAGNFPSKNSPRCGSSKRTRVPSHCSAK
jgi:hypothetical protein